MNNFINFNQIIDREVFNEYGGSEKKKTVYIDGEKYLLKFPDPSREIKLELSYVNNAISEYIGCRVFDSVNIPVQETYLGVYVTEDGKEKVACACRDIRDNGNSLYEAEKLELGSIDTKSSVSFNDVMHIMNNIKGLDSKKAFSEYCDRFIIDGLIGNTDRHNGNWGILVDKEGHVKLAPVYDCGSCMSPLLDDTQLNRENRLNEAKNALTAVRNNDGKRTTFRDLLFGCDNRQVNESLCRMTPLINNKKIYSIIDDIPYISEDRKQFYKDLIFIRYEQILIPALEKSLNITNNKEYENWNSKIIQAIYDTYIEDLCALPDSFEGQIILKNKEYDVIKNNDRVFLMSKDVCIGEFLTLKSNQNITKFVEVMKNIGNPIDMEMIKTTTKSTTSFNDKTLIADAKATLCNEKTKINPQKSHQKNHDIGGRT